MVPPSIDHVIMTSQRNDYDILQTHVLSIMARLPGITLQQDNACQHTASISQDDARQYSARNFHRQPSSHFHPFIARSIPRFVAKQAYLGWEVRQPASLIELEVCLQQLWNTKCLNASCV
ncbi:hypothetical protein TNCV_869981 [Trichonephila clavipes]|nr:hypothetical protein TNCV_869981 [Trichonephila clavipes]